MTIKVGDKEYNLDGYANTNELQRALEDCYKQGRNDAIRDNIEAIEKQIPKKPDYIYNEFSKSSKRWRCPNCTTLIYEIDKDNCAWGHQADYCEDCGQAIDWSEND